MSIHPVAMMLKRSKTRVRTTLETLRSLRQLPAAWKLRSRLQSSPVYLLYLCSQLDKSTRYAGRIGNRTRRLVDMVIRSAAHDAVTRQSASVLCIGCRNTHELDLFRQAGFTSVTGVDLFASDPRIVEMDMHALRFADDQFDIVYSCHSLEHSFAPPIAVREFIRVAKPGALCVVEVPIRFQTSASDLFDYGSIDGLRDIFRPYVGNVLFAEEDLEEGGADVARIAFQVAKPLGVAVAGAP
jgi:SAM-dependent methyltransferase